MPQNIRTYYGQLNIGKQKFSVKLAVVNEGSFPVLPSTR
jgi:hypothetical protein